MSYYRRPGGRKGSLEQLPQMPLDIVFEVFSYLQPMDLLNLPRTNKPFRDLLMSRRNAANFWKSARRNIEGLPDCPPDLSEPEYANLCFDPHCHSCLRTNIHNIIWEFRKRYCLSCRKNETISFDDAIARALDDFDVTPPFVFAQFTTTNQNPDEYDNIRVQKADVVKFYEEWDVGGNDELLSLLDGLAAKRKPIMEHAQKCHEWVEYAKVLRAQEKENDKEKRATAIMTKLCEIGYSDEVEYLCDLGRFFTNPLYELPSVNRPGPLTTRGWNSIKKSLIPLMEFYRKKRRVDFKSRRADQDCNMFPQPHDFVSNKFVTPYWVDTSEHFSAKAYYNLLQPLLPKIVKAWRDDLMDRVNVFLRLGPYILPQYVDLTRLAICNYFLCSSYDSCCCDRGPIALHDLLSHTCLTSWRNPEEVREEYRKDFGDVVEDAMNLELVSEKWSPANTEPCIERMRYIIEAFGHDPMTATVVEMDQLDARIFCKLCAERWPETRIILTWREAIHHVQSNTHSRDIHVHGKSIMGWWGRVPDSYMDIIPGLQSRVEYVEDNDDSHRMKKRKAAPIDVATLTFQIPPMKAGMKH
ncbi:hypothetical protein QCA50_002247 [Cerrena zonata]|uniref:F-box domain-containing protein n=1 Tax=Cerrena zonata TaxID=2478898 RepID=A0AAW0GWK7_9APHY